MTLPEWIGWLLVGVLSVGTLVITAGWLAPLWFDSYPCETCGGFGYLEDSAGSEDVCWRCGPDAGPGQGTET